tara:strand:+ start:2198 stop:3556 length:1359 start_codon:yes stop_codon:yes gene_type:complete
MWKLEDWQYPCYNVNNGRCKSLLKWNKTYNFIYEEQTKNISPILTIKRPHSRSFYLSLFGLILSFCAIFNFNSIYLLYYNITSNDVRIDNIIIFSSAMITRFFISLFSDKYGIRIIYSILLLATALIGILKILLIKYTTISRVLTGFYGILGGSFVLSETWVIIMFDVDNLGLITGIVGGLGNFGSAIVFLINYNLPNIYYCNWVYILMIILSFIIYKYSDDCPYGNFNEIIKEHNNNNNRNLDNTIDSNYTNDNEINLEVIVNDIECNLERKCSSMKNMKIFTLSLIYLYSVGLEMTLYSNIIILTEYENKSNKDKILVIFYFSILNIICRPIGGYISDIQYKYFKIIGKIKIMILFQLFTLIFGALYYNTMLIHYLILLSGCNNLLQGSIIGIIPHINSKNLGINLGVISGFGILGGIIGNILFYYFKNTMLYINIYNTFTFILNIFCLL